MAELCWLVVADCRCCWPEVAVVGMQRWLEVGWSDITDTLPDQQDSHWLTASHWRSSRNMCTIKLYFLWFQRWSFFCGSHTKCLLCLLVLQYLIWSFLWLAWNLFIMCLYLGIGVLTKVCDFSSFNFTLYDFHKNISEYLLYIVLDSFNWYLNMN